MFSKKACLLSLCITLMALPALAAFPDKPLHFVAHSTVGGNMDVVLRQLGKGMDEVLPVPTVVDARPGGGTAVAMQYVASNPQLGYYILGAANPNLSTPLTSPSPVSIRDLRAVCMLSIDATGLIVSSKSPYTDLQSFLEAAKTKSMTVAVPQLGSVEHMLGVRLVMQGYKLQIIPYESSNDLNMAILGSHIDAGISLSPSVFSAAKNNQVRLLTVFAKTRLADFPDVPTSEESGMGPLDIVKYKALMVARDTPDDIVAYLEKAAQHAMSNSKSFKEYCANNNVDLYFMPAAETDAFLKDLEKTTRDVLAEMGMLMK